MATSSIDFISGTFGGLMVVLFGHPFDTTKTRLQTAPSGYYSSTMDCFRKTYHLEGMKGFYKGVTSPLAGQMIFRACVFGTFHTTLKRMRAEPSNSSSHSTTTASRYDEPLKLKDYFLAGGLTGFTVAFVEVRFALLFLQISLIILIDSNRFN